MGKSKCRLERALDRHDSLLIALIERPLPDPLGSNESRLHQDSQMLAGGWLPDPELLRNEQAAHAVVDEIAFSLWGEVRSWILQPSENLETSVVGQGLDHVSGQRS